MWCEAPRRLLSRALLRQRLVELGHAEQIKEEEYKHLNQFFTTKVEVGFSASLK
jgi:hypothetical protein